MPERPLTFLMYTYYETKGDRNVAKDLNAIKSGCLKTEDKEVN